MSQQQHFVAAPSSPATVTPDRRETVWVLPPATTPSPRPSLTSDRNASYYRWLAELDTQDDEFYVSYTVPDENPFEDWDEVIAEIDV